MSGRGWARDRTASGVVLVVGTCGGVGASTLAALLAVRRGPTTLVDLAPASGGLDVTLGIETSPGPRWADLDGAGAGADLPRRLPRWRGVRVLSADRSGTAPDPAALVAAWAALSAAGGRLVVDLPVAGLAGAGPVVTAASEVVLVVGQDVRGVAGAIAARALLGAGPVRVVVRERRGARVAPAEIESVLGAPLTVRIPSDRAVAEAAEAGLGPVCPARSRLGRAVAVLDSALGSW